MKANDYEAPATGRTNADPATSHKRWRGRFDYLLPHDGPGFFLKDAPEGFDFNHYDNRYGYPEPEEEGEGEGYGEGEDADGEGESGEG